MSRRRGFLVLCAVALAVGCAFPVAAGAAAITVDDTTDPATIAGDNDGDCTLREAVQATNDNTDINGADDCDHDGLTTADTIDLPGGSISLLGAAGDNANSSGDLDIEPGAGLTIDGAGPGPSAIVGSTAPDRVIEIENVSPGPVTIRDVTIKGGRVASDGAGILAGARGLTLSNVHVDDNDVTTGVGANGGGVSYDPSTNATLRVEDSSFTGNSATRAGGAIEVSPDGFLSMERSYLFSNKAGEAVDAASMQGGAIYNQGGTNIRTSFFFLNTAEHSGPGIIETIVAGGAISTDPSNQNLTVTGTTFLDNTAQAVGVGATGGAINGGAGFVFNSSFFGNRAREGGAIGQQVILGSPNGGPFILVLHSTFSGNPGISAGNDDHGVLTAIGTGEIELRNNLIAEGGARVCATPQPGGSFISRGGNVVSDSSCPLNGPRDLNAGAGLGTTLGPISNLGPEVGADSALPAVAMREPKAGSPAIDRIPVAACTDFDDIPVTVDQRGKPRPFGAACDSGAHEVTRCRGAETTIFGTAGADSLRGTPAGDVIAGQRGDDVIAADAGDDRICGGPGSDAVGFSRPVRASFNSSTGQGADLFDSIELLLGSPGADVLTGSPRGDTILGRGGRDRIRGLAGRDILRGGRGPDALRGGGGPDRLFGQAGRDKLNGGGGRPDVCNGGGGRDRRRARGCERRKRIP